VISLSQEAWNNEAIREHCHITGVTLFECPSDDTVCRRSLSTWRNWSLHQKVRTKPNFHISSVSHSACGSSHIQHQNWCWLGQWSEGDSHQNDITSRRRTAGRTDNLFKTSATLHPCQTRSFEGTKAAWSRGCYEVDALFFFSFPLLFLFYHIYTYKDHSLRLVVRRPYSGLTFPLITLLTNIYICGLPRSTAEHCLISFRTGSGLTHCPTYF